MKLGSFTKQTIEARWISIFYTDDLDDGDEVTTVESCVVEPAGELTVSPVLSDVDRVRVLHDGGVHGTDYKISTTVYTAGGERFQDEIICRVRDV